jgi:hypothetical protein
MSTPPITPLGANGNGYVVIPKWFVSFLSFVVSVVFAGAAVWAWQMSADVSAIKAEVRAQNELRSAELEDMRRRLNRHDELFDRLWQRGERP